MATRSKKKKRANYMKRHREMERKLILIGKFFVQKHPQLVEKEFGRIPKVKFDDKIIQPRLPKTKQPQILSLLEKPKKRRGRKQK